MGINNKIKDKIVIKCKKDLNMRVFITEILQVEADRVAHYKDPYKELVERFSIGDDENENK